MNNIPLARDLALKRTVHAPVDQKPLYAWRDGIPCPPSYSSARTARSAST